MSVTEPRPTGGPVLVADGVTVAVPGHPSGRPVYESWPMVTPLRRMRSGEKQPQGPVRYVGTWTVAVGANATPAQAGALLAALHASDLRWRPATLAPGDSPATPVEEYRVRVVGDLPSRRDFVVNRVPATFTLQTVAEYLTPRGVADDQVTVPFGHAPDVLAGSWSSRLLDFGRWTQPAPYLVGGPAAGQLAHGLLLRSERPEFGGQAYDLRTDTLDWSAIQARIAWAAAAAGRTAVIPGAVFPTRRADVYADHIHFDGTTLYTLGSSFPQNVGAVWHPEWRPLFRSGTVYRDEHLVGDIPALLGVGLPDPHALTIDVEGPLDPAEVVGHQYLMLIGRLGSDSVEAGHVCTRRVVGAERLLTVANRWRLTLDAPTDHEAHTMDMVVTACTPAGTAVSGGVTHALFDLQLAAPTTMQLKVDNKWRRNVQNGLTQPLAIPINRTALRFVDPSTDGTVVAHVYHNALAQPEDDTSGATQEVAYWQPGATSIRVSAAAPVPVGSIARWNDEVWMLSVARPLHARATGELLLYHPGDVIRATSLFIWGATSVDFTGLELRTEGHDRGFTTLNCGNVNTGPILHGPFPGFYLGRACDMQNTRGGFVPLVRAEGCTGGLLQCEGATTDVLWDLVHATLVDYRNGALIALSRESARNGVNTMLVDGTPAASPTDPYGRSSHSLIGLADAASSVEGEASFTIGDLDVRARMISCPLYHVENSVRYVDAALGIDDLFTERRTRTVVLDLYAGQGAISFRGHIRRLTARLESSVVPAAMRITRGEYALNVSGVATAPADPMDQGEISADGVAVPFVPWGRGFRVLSLPAGTHYAREGRIELVPPTGSGAWPAPGSVLELELETWNDPAEDAGDDESHVLTLATLTAGVTATMQWTGGATSRLAGRWLYVLGASVVYNQPVTAGTVSLVVQRQVGGVGAFTTVFTRAMSAVGESRARTISNFATSADVWDPADRFQVRLAPSGTLAGPTSATVTLHLAPAL